MSETAARPEGPGPWRFPLLAVTASWSMWGIVIMAGPALPHAATVALLMAGFAAVAVAAVVFVLWHPAAPGPRAFWTSIIDVRRIPAAAWLAAALLMPALAFVAAAADAFANGLAIETGPLLQALTRPMALLRMFAFSLLAGPFFEELGWRGLALAPLQRRYGALAGALLLGCVHALWHLPLFIAPEGYFHGMGLLTPAFWQFMAEIVMFDLLASALFNFAGRSTLSAVVFHCSFNAAGALWVLTPAAGTYRDGLCALAVALLVLGTRGRMFLAQERRADPAPRAPA